MKRGDVIKVALQGDYGKPRPAVVIRSDRFNDTHASFLVCPMTSTLQDFPVFRVRVAPTPANGLRQASDIVADQIYTIRSEKAGEVLGRLDAAVMSDLDQAIAIFTGLAD
jgi:mRNA interferase MazF